MRLLADENFDGRILEGLRARLPSADVVRVQDTEISGAPDPKVLEWAAKLNRILLSHDVRTLINYAYARVQKGLAMPGVIEVQRATSIGEAIDELEILIGAGQVDDFENQVRYIPMR